MLEEFSAGGGMSALTDGSTGGVGPLQFLTQELVDDSGLSYPGDTQEGHSPAWH
jgi:hypothetical protein